MDNEIVHDSLILAKETGMIFDVVKRKATFELSI